MQVFFFFLIDFNKLLKELSETLGELTGDTEQAKKFLSENDNVRGAILILIVQRE